MNVFINNFINCYNTKNFTPSVEFGQYSLLNRTTASANYSGGNQLADLRLRTDFQCIGKQKRLELDDTYTDLNGFNREFITTAGVYNVEAALKEFSRTDFGKRVVTRDIEAQISCLSHRDCHTSFLYNMLISWGKAILHKMNGHDDDEINLEVKSVPYTSQHVRVGLPDLNPRTYAIELTEPCDPGLAPQMRRRDENYFTRPYVLHYNAATGAQEWFYLLHVAGRDKVSALNFDLKIPGISSNSVILDPVNAQTDTISNTGFDDINWADADRIWSWIIDYVSLNRIEQQFAATLELFGAMFFHPIWSSAEGCHWQMSELVAVLGTFSPTRARLRTNLEGNAYSTDQTAHEYVLDAQVKPIAYLLNSSMLNYYMWYGLYSVVHNFASDRDDWRSALVSVQDELQMLYTPHMRAFCIGAILNHDVPTSMTHGAGMYVSMSEMDQVYHITYTQPGTSGEHADVDIDALYAPVSGSLILGTLSGELSTVVHLKASYECKLAGGRTTVYSIEELTKLASIYRLFGHEITLFDNITGERVKPWAAVNECIIEPASIGFDPTKIQKLTIGHSDMREGRAIPLPALGALSVDGSISILIQKPTVEVICFGTAQKPVRTYTTSRRDRKVVPIKVKSGYSYRPETFRASKGNTYKQLGFYEGKRHIPPDNPEGVVVTEPIQHTVTTGDQETNVATVETKSYAKALQPTPQVSSIAVSTQETALTPTTTSSRPTGMMNEEEIRTASLDSGGQSSSQQ
jgi:hypothetical protein